MESFKGPLAAFTASVTWVVGSTVYTHLAKRLAPAAVNFNRALVALPCFVLASALQFRDVAQSLDALGPAVWSRAGWLGVSILASYVLGDVCFMWAAVSVGFPAAQAVGALYPLWAALGGVVFVGEPLTLQKGAGLALAIAGTVAVVLAGRRGERTPPPEHMGFLRRYEVGIGFAFLTSLFWGLNSFAGGRGGQGMNAAFANALRMTVALALCPLLARAQSGPGVRLLLAPAEYKKLVPFFVIEAFVGSYLYIYGLSHSSVAVGATLSSLAPVVAVPVAVALRWERFSLATTAGVLIVVGGVALLVS